MMKYLTNLKLMRYLIVRLQKFNTTWPKWEDVKTSFFLLLLIETLFMISSIIFWTSDFALIFTILLNLLLALIIFFSFLAAASLRWSVSFQNSSLDFMTSHDL